MDLSKPALQECDTMSLTIIMAWLAVIVAVEAVTEIVVASKIFFPLRDWFSRNPDPKGFWAKARSWIGELLNCGHCASVWVALLAAHFAPTGACTGCVKYAWPIFFIKVFVIHRLSNLMHELFSRWFSRSPFSFVFTHIHNKVEDGSKES